LNSTIAWNFGDTGSHYNNLVGFNAAHAYANAGTYTITLTITTPDGHVGITTKQITISQDNRPTIYVAADGSDSNDGSSASAPIQSVARLNELIGSNVRVLFHDGDTFDLGEDHVNVGHMDDVYIGSYGSGDKPVLMFNGTPGNGNIIGIDSNTQGLVVQGLTFDSIYPDDRDTQPILSAFTMVGNDITIRDNTFLNVLNDMGGGAVGATNVLVQDNASPLATGLSQYFYFMGGVGNSDIVVIGNQVADSTHEAVLRIGGSSDILIADNNFTELTADLTTVPGGKNVLSIQEGSYAYIYNNVLNTGPVELGPIGTPAADPNGIFQYAVFDSNLLANGAIFNINPNAQNAMYKNNVVLGAQNTGFTINAEQDIHSVHWQVQNIWIENNTVTDPAGLFAGFLSINNGEAAGIHLDNNLFVDPGLETGIYSGFVKDDNSDMNSFAEIKNNVWSVPSSAASGGGYFFLSPISGSSAGWLTPAEWEATGVPTGDVYENVTLGSTFSTTLIDGSTAGSTLPH
jgi:PKD repeat protein